MYLLSLHFLSHMYLISLHFLSTIVLLFKVCTLLSQNSFFHHVKLNCIIILFDNVFLRNYSACFTLIVS